MFDKEMVHESFESNLLAEEVGESTNLHRDTVKRERGREERGREEREIDRERGHRL